MVKPLNFIMQKKKQLPREIKNYVLCFIMMVYEKSSHKTQVLRPCSPSSGTVKK